jgi:hypothetical protein
MDNATLVKLFPNLEVHATRGAKPQHMLQDNSAESLHRLLAENRLARAQPWPPPCNRTSHRLHLGDARDLSWIGNSSVHLVVTSPSYWTLKEYNQRPGQLAQIGPGCWHTVCAVHYRQAATKGYAKPFFRHCASALRRHAVEAESRAPAILCQPGPWSVRGPVVFGPNC